MIQTGKDYLLFDGDCGICTWSSEIVKRMDAKRLFTVERQAVCTHGAACCAQSPQRVSPPQTRPRARPWRRSSTLSRTASTVK